MTTCRIDQPVVDARAQNGFAYPNVVFHAGDLVTVTADGCVQTGGFHNTWKRYVNPRGRDSQRLYHGTIRIPGVMPPGSLLEIGAWVNRQIPIRSDPGPNPFLLLGYVDDGYADNSYKDHDDGDDGQCKLGVRPYGGPAFVEITIQHNTLPPVSQVPAPFDVVGDMLDSNGLQMNPQWGWEANSASRTAPNSNGKEATTDPEPDATQVCDGFPYASGSSWDASQGVKLGSPPCTTQVGSRSFDDPTPAVGVEDPRLLFNNVGCIEAGPAQGLLHGHMNWWPATITGRIQWSGNISGVTLDASGHEHHGDDDYCFFLFPVNDSLLFHHERMSLGTLSRPDYIEVEMDADETAHHFGSKWWSDFHSAVNSLPELTASRMIDGHEALVTGLVNIDQEHDHGHAELHPIYAMAIHVNDGSPGFAKDPNDDKWAVFARNWGNEGFCSQDQHFWDVPTVSIFIPEPFAASDYEVLDLDLFTNKSVASHHGKVPGGLVIKFDLGAPEDRAMVDGSLRIHWKPAGGTPGTIAASVAPGHNPSPWVRAAPRPEPEEGIQVLKGLPPKQAAMVLRQLKRPPPVKNGLKVTTTRIALTADDAPHAFSRARFKPPKMRTVPDVARAERAKHELQIICAARKNKIPGYPNVCSH